MNKRHWKLFKRNDYAINCRSYRLNNCLNLDNFYYTNNNRDGQDMDLIHGEIKNEFETLQVKAPIGFKRTK